MPITFEQRCRVASRSFRKALDKSWRKCAWIQSVSTFACSYEAQCENCSVRKMFDAGSYCSCMGVCTIVSRMHMRMHALQHAPSAQSAGGTSVM